MLFMVSQISSNFSNANPLQATALKKDDDAKKTTLQAPIKDSVQLSTLNAAQVPEKKHKKGSFWERNFAAIMGVTSIALVGITIASAIKNKRIKGVGEKGYKNPYTPELSFETVFHNYKNDKSVPTLAELPGMTEAKRNFQRNIIDAIKYEDLYKANDVPTLNAAILHGPPGTGKTNLVKVLAKELDAEVATFAVYKDGSPLVNQAAINLKSRADFVKNAALNNPEKQYIAFFDEIEGMLTEDKSGNNPSRQELIKTVLVTLDEFKRIPNLRVLATTNEKLNHGTGFFKNMNEAAMDRFPVKIFIDNPDKDAITGAVKYHLKKSKDAVNLLKNDEAIDRISDNLLGYSHRNIEDISSEAKRFLIEEQSRARDAGKNTNIPLEERHFNKAIEEFQQSKNPTEEAEEIYFSNPMEAFQELYKPENMQKIREGLENFLENIASTFENRGKAIGAKGAEEAGEIQDDVLKNLNKKPKVETPTFDFSSLSKDEITNMLKEKTTAKNTLEERLKTPHLNKNEIADIKTQIANLGQEVDALLDAFNKAK
jgi:ATP-dependent 26S proteasome regulatory subunit